VTVAEIGNMIGTLVARHVVVTCATCHEAQPGLLTADGSEAQLQLVTYLGRLLQDDLWLLHVLHAMKHSLGC
jgi:hypothetical protein